MIPVVTVIVPVHGRSGLTRGCLDAVLSNAGDIPFELVVVDDGSRDDTAQVLRSYGSAVQVITREETGGFAAACNAGAAVAQGRHLVFLNNDTVPARGWLDALVRHVDAHPQVAIAGSKLLFPDGTVQHAGVAICQDGLPRHLYAGLPADHPVTTRRRRVQAVSAASMLIRHTVFTALGGFDTGFRNALEDVDLCLRAGQAGHEVHVCAESVVRHLESATRGRRAADFAASHALFDQRWATAHRDDLEHYVMDGLLTIGYDELHPHRMRVSAEVAIVEHPEQETDRLLLARARQVHDLLREVVRLTVELAELPQGRPVPWGAGADPVPRLDADHERLLQRARDIELEIDALQEEAQRGRAVPLAGGVLSYRRLVRDIRAVVEERVPAGACVAVISRGDDELVRFAGRHGRHFPQTEDGRYSGAHPADSTSAIAQLEAIRTDGVEFLVIPKTELWWLDHYDAFRLHVETNHERHHFDETSCVIYALQGK